MILKVVVRNPPIERAATPKDHDEFSPIAIVERIKSGDRSAESQLVNFYSDKLMFILQRKFSDKELCRDAHQEAFAVIIQKIRAGQVREPAKLAGFMRSTAINLALMAIRKNKNMIAMSHSPIIENISYSGHSAYQDIAESELADILKGLINELAIERDRRILISFYITQLDKMQICQQLDLSPDHFDKIIYRSKQRLKTLILTRHKHSLFATVRLWIMGRDKGGKHA